MVRADTEPRRLAAPTTLRRSHRVRGQGMQVNEWEHNRLGESAVFVTAQRSPSAAEVAPSCSTQFAVLARREVGLACDPLPDPASVGLRAGLDYLPQDLVPHHHRWFVPVFVRGAVDVGSADSGGDDFDAGESCGDARIGTCCRVTPSRPGPCLTTASMVVVVDFTVDAIMASLSRGVVRVRPDST